MVTNSIRVRIVQRVLMHRLNKVILVFNLMLRILLIFNTIKSTITTFRYY